MKKSLSIFAAIILLFAATPTSFAAIEDMPIEANAHGNTVYLEYGNLLFHGDMEQASDGTYPNLPLGWEWPYDSSAGAMSINTVAQDNSISNTGKSSLKIDLSNMKQAQGLLFSQQVNGVEPGVEYGLTVAANITSLSGAKFETYIRWLDSGGAEISTSPLRNVSWSTNRFESLWNSAPAPQGAVSAEVRFSVTGVGDGGSATAYIDSVVFQRENYIKTTTVSRDGVEVVSGAGNFFTDTDVPASPDPTVYTVTFKDGSGTVLGTQTVSVSKGGQEGNATTTVVGGQLTMTPTLQPFSAVVLDTESNTLQSSSTGSIKVKDDRGEGHGWSAKARGTDFVSDLIPDPSSNGAGSYRLSIPVNSLTITPGSVSIKGGQAIDNVGGPLVSPITLTASAQSIVTALPGFGMGSYDVPLSFSINVPKTVTVVAQSGTGSKYNVGQSVGTVATTYHSTITYIIGAGI